MQKNYFLLLKKIKNTSSAQLWKNTILKQFCQPSDRRRSEHMITVRGSVN